MSLVQFWRTASIQCFSQISSTRLWSIKGLFLISDIMNIGTLSWWLGNKSLVVNQSTASFCLSSLFLFYYFLMDIFLSLPMWGVLYIDVPRQSVVMQVSSSDFIWCVDPADKSPSRIALSWSNWGWIGQYVWCNSWSCFPHVTMKKIPIMRRGMLIYVWFKGMFNVRVVEIFPSWARVIIQNSDGRREDTTLLGF